MWKMKMTPSGSGVIHQRYMEVNRCPRKILWDDDEKNEWFWSAARSPWYGVEVQQVECSTCDYEVTGLTADLGITA